MIQLKEGKGSVTRGQLRAVELVTPEWASPRWKGIQHGELVDTIVNRLENKQVEILGESWYLNQNEAALQGYMKLKLPNEKAPEGMDFCLGIQHSNNGDASLKFAVGAKVFICSNGLISGDFVVKRMHTIGLELEKTISVGIDMYVEQAKELGNVVTSMKERELGKRQTDRMLMSAGRDGLLAWSRIGEVDKEYRKPTFGDFKQRTAWGLYNAFTYVAQKQPAHHQMKSIKGFKEIVLN